MQDLLEKVIEEIGSTMILPTVSDRELRSIVGFILNVAFSMIREETEKLN